VRTLANTPLFTLAVVVTLALGIGANTAIFTVTNALLLRPFPYHDPEQIGVIAGLRAALALTRFLQHVLYKTGSRDLATFLLAPLVFLFVAAFASYLPARRAMKLEPVEILK
jgi:ABC-type antimicrobial peptide transport system permease subunit